MGKVVSISHRKRGKCLECGREDVYIAAFGQCAACYQKARRGKARKHFPEDLHNPDHNAEVKQQRKQWRDLEAILSARQVPEDVLVQVQEILLSYFQELVPHLAKEIRQAALLRGVLRRYTERAGLPVDVDVEEPSTPSTVNITDFVIVADVNNVNDDVNTSTSAEESAGEGSD